MQNSFPKPILELFKKACELIDQEGVRGLFTRLLGRFPRGDIAPLALGWVPESERLSPQELKVLVGSIIDRSHARDFCELLPRYQADKDQLRSDGSIQSIRELKRRVSLIESGLRLEDIPGPLQEITNAPGFDFKALADFLAQAKFQALCDGAFDDRQILAPCVELYPASDVQELLNAALFPGPRRDPRYRAIYRKIKSSLGYIPAKGAQLTTEEQQKVFASLLEFPGIIKNYLKLEVLKKSDPRGWVSGNYTDCCIPFGDPQMTTLMFGPDTQFLIVSLCTPGSSSDRIITQSVIVRRHDDRIDRARPVRYYRRFSDASKEFLEADPGQRTQYALLDNLEMANNYGEYSAAVKQAVLQFCALAADRPRYLGTFFSDIGFPEAVLTESFFGLHQSEVRYMDYNDSYVYALPEKPNNTALREEIVFSSLSRRHLGIVSDIERECYPEIMLRSEQELLEYLSEQQQRFFKLDFVPDGLSSFLVRQGPRSVGYVLMDKAESEVYPEEAVLVISDLAVLPGFRNLKVLRSIFGRVLQAARIHGLSVEFEARNATTMSLIETPFGRRFIQRHGFHLCELGALTDYYPGHDFTRIRLESSDLGRQLMIEWPQGEPMISANLMQEEDEEREWQKTLAARNRG